VIVKLLTRELLDAGKYLQVNWETEDRVFSAHFRIYKMRPGPGVLMFTGCYDQHSGAQFVPIPEDMQKVCAWAVTFLAEESEW
jgi:hypothetical protein